jgi:hypothetical protein
MQNETIQIHLNSKQAISYNNLSYSDCNFVLPNIVVEPQHYLYLSVVHCVIPSSFYNINSNNDALVYSVNGGSPTSLYISHGNYNSKQLANYLTSNMPNFNVVYNPINNTFTFTNSLYNFIINTESTCLTLLGFPGLLLYQTSILKSLTSYQSIDLQPNKCICILSNINTGSINLSNKCNMNILLSIPNTVAPYSLITYDNPSPPKFNLFTSSLSFLNLKITNQNNELLNLNNVHWSITLQIDVVKFVDE